MVCIELVTDIAAPIERCFDLSRSIDLHMASTHGTREQAIAGVTAGLIGMHETVTWRGRHFGLTIHHTSRITIFNRPLHFQDCMVRGAFKTFCHDHYFEDLSGHTRMRDKMVFEAPFGFVGRAVEIFLDRYMRRLLEQRNRCIKRVSESNEWHNFLPA